MSRRKFVSKETRTKRHEKARLRAEKKNSTGLKKSSNKPPTPWAVKVRQRSEENAYRARIGLPLLKTPKKSKTGRAIA